ncbi:MAG TPA: hypothetical protein VGR38_06955 [Candidatus Polarisedimenticolia bacterium]|nr:hypothetical protein [Candidatus Polarisedimenticolia bacterium]
MRKAVLLALVLLAAAGVALAKNAQRILLGFDTMYGVEGPLLGEANAIRGVVGDELPWEIAHFAKGRLDTNGRLTISVHGLVFADDPLVPPDLVGKNDETEFRGLVSCLTEDAQGAIVTENVVTDGFPATVTGDSLIRQNLELPNPCIAPIIFVLAGSEDKWFAVTGFESESGEGERGH